MSSTANNHLKHITKTVPQGFPSGTVLALSRIFLKDLGKVALVHEADGHGDINDRVFGVGKKPFAFFNPHHVQVFFEGKNRWIA